MFAVFHTGDKEQRERLGAEAPELTILAKLACALSRARAVPLAA